MHVIIKTEFLKIVINLFFQDIIFVFSICYKKRGLSRFGTVELSCIKVARIFVKAFISFR